MSRPRGEVRRPVHVTFGTEFGREVKSAKLLNDGVGTATMLVDGSVTAVDFRRDVPEGETWRVKRITLVVADAGVWPEDSLGAASAPTNGLTIDVHDGDDVLWTVASGLRTNADLAGLMGRNSGLLFNVSATDSWVAFHLDLDEPIVLAEGQGLRVVVSDNLTSTVDTLYAAILYTAAEVEP
jgi:hypothetical protein